MLSTLLPEGLGPLLAVVEARADVDGAGMVTVGSGTVTVLGMVGVEVEGVAQGVMDTVLVMLGMTTAGVDGDEPVVPVIVAWLGVASVAPAGEFSVVAVALGA